MTQLPCLPPVRAARKPATPTPARACDAHFHIFGPSARFPYAATRAYAPEDAPLERLLGMHTAGCGRAADDRAAREAPDAAHRARPLRACLGGARRGRRSVRGGAALSCRGAHLEKLSGPYRVSSRYPDYEDVRPLHEALLAANPDQLLWGTDWPHPRLGQLLDLFNAWTPEPLRSRILVDNPARLYGFA